MRLTTKQILPIFLWLWINLLLTGCASLRDNFALQHQSLSWQQHQQQTLAFNAWHIVGKIGVSDGEQGGSANLTWQQQQASFDISLSGPFGTETIYISGSPGNVEFTSAKGVRHTASSAEAIIKQELGWTVPVSGLVYWSRGLPIPGIPTDKIQFTKENRLANLQQQGWSIEYLEYKAFAERVLPAKISLTNQNIKVKLIFRSWL